MRLKMNRRTFLKMTGTAVLAGALAGCGGSGSGNGGGNGGNPGGGDGPENPGGGEEPGNGGGGEDKPGSGKKEKGYYTATTPDTQGVYWTYYYEGSGTEVSLTGYNRRKGARPNGKVTLPSTLDGLRVTEVDSNAFDMLYKCDKNYGDPETENYTWSDFSAVTEMTVPASIRWIGQAAFNGCVNAGVGTHRTATMLKKVTFLGNVHLVFSAFYDCDKLEEVVGWEKIESPDGYLVREGCFGNTGFKELTVTPNMMSFNAFADCKKLEKVTIQKGNDRISSGIFSCCYALSRVYIPSTVKTIEDDAFYAYPEEDIGTKPAELTVYYGGSEAQWKNLMQKTADGNDRLKNATVRYGQSPDDMK